MSEYGLPEPAATGSPAPASSPLPDGIIEGDGWLLYIDLDGWYLREGGGTAKRISVDDAVRRVGQRGQVFRRTRMFIAHVANQLAERAWISPVAPGFEQARSRGLDPKLRPSRWSGPARTSRGSAASSQTRKRRDRSEPSWLSTLAARRPWACSSASVRTRR
jgi:hypothetical protein